MKIKRFALGALWTNCYLIWDARGDGFVVDPGGPAEDVDNFIRDNDIHIHWIVLTHGHADHIGGIPDLRNLSENGIAVHYADASALTDPNKNLSSMMGESLTMRAPDRELKDGDVLSAGEMSIKVIYTPGHTVGGICLLVSEGEEQMLISGDTLFARSIGRSDLPGGDEGVLIESLKKLANLPDKMRVFPGHGPETTIGAERQHNPYWPR